METQHDNTQATATAGTLDLTIWYIGHGRDTARGVRRRYRYRIVDTDRADIAPFEDSNLRSGIGDPINATAALGTLVSLLSAAAEIYRIGMQHPDSPLGQPLLFPGWVPEAAYLNDSELQSLAMELEPDPEEAFLRHTEHYNGPRRQHRPAGSPTMPDSRPPSAPSNGPAL